MKYESRCGVWRQELEVGGYALEVNLGGSSEAPKPENVRVLEHVVESFSDLLAQSVGRAVEHGATGLNLDPQWLEVGLRNSGDSIEFALFFTAGDDYQLWSTIFRWFGGSAVLVGHSVRSW